MRSFLFAAFSFLASAAPTLGQRALANGVALRILPLGDSITYGYQSSDGNGYRKSLYDQLTADGNAVEMIGSVRSGNMSNNQNEGHNGARIAEIAKYANSSLPDRPNVVLLMAGTNDIYYNENPAGAPQRLASFIDQITTACPDAAVIVAQITPMADVFGKDDARAVTFNSALKVMVTQKSTAGSHVLLVDMHSALTTDDLTDNLHPTDHGYELMAGVWYRGIQQAISQEWIAAPAGNGTGSG